MEKNPAGLAKTGLLVHNEYKELDGFGIVVGKGDGIMTGNLSRQSQLKIFFAVVLLLLAGAGALWWYFAQYTKTPEYSMKMIEESVARHDMAKFQKYVDVDHLLDTASDALMEGLIDADRPMSEEARTAVSGFTKMFKAPLVLSFKAAINHYIESGEWGTDASKAADQGIPIDSDLVLAKSGLKDLSFRRVDHVAVDKEAGTAVAGVRVYQAEAGEEFVLEVRFVRADSGIWRASEILNFRDFITFAAQARQSHMQEYLEDSASIMERHDKNARQVDKKLQDILAAGSLGNDDTRSTVKKLMQEEAIPDWQQRKAELEEMEVPSAAGTLHRLRLRICDLRLAYAEGYAAWMDDKQAGTIRAADAKLKEAHTLEHEAAILVSQARARMK